MANLGVQMQERPTQGLLHLGFSLSPDSPGPPVQGRSLLNRKRYWNGSRHLGLGAKVFPLEENCNAKISPFEATAYAVLFKHQLELLPTHVCVLHMLLCTHGERGLAGSFSAVSIFVCWKKNYGQNDFLWKYSLLQQIFLILPLPEKITMSLVLIWESRSSCQSRVRHTSDLPRSL